MAEIKKSSETISKKLNKYLKIIKKMFVVCSWGILVIQSKIPPKLAYKGEILLAGFYALGDM